MPPVLLQGREGRKRRGAGWVDSPAPPKDLARAIIFVKRALQECRELEEAKALLDQLR